MGPNIWNIGPACAGSMLNASGRSCFTPSERYLDAATIRKVAVGTHDAELVLIPYDESEGVITPVTIHVTTRRQIEFRIQSGRFIL